MKKVLFIISTIFLNSSYSMQEGKNLFAYLPAEMQEHIYQSIYRSNTNEFETQEESLRKLERHQIGTEDQSIGTDEVGLFVAPNGDVPDEHLMLFDKKKKTTNLLIAINRIFDYVPMNQPSWLPYPAFFAFSPNNKQIIFDSTNLYRFKNKEIKSNDYHAQNCVCLIDLLQKKVRFLNLDAIFPNKIKKIDKSTSISKYEEKGYKLIDSSDSERILKHPFLYMAIANNGILAVVNKNNLEKDNSLKLESDEDSKLSKIYVISPKTGRHKVLDTFRNNLFSVKAMRFNAQATRLFVDFRDKDNVVQILKEYEILKPKTLLDYFEKMGVCKAENFYQNNA